ncbi:YraN family protein [Patescibacteria group bacterium]|nr:YraN family protein [Patescibacteria group bacterium]MBU1472586.1 YraN family protein [Patescibacteria group bacterium]MBU2459837.1 YraN family protein [Patescibacteria group bacterium]MBU2544102.1 YraN family protein [Patescibacteria group bacterium]
MKKWNSVTGKHGEDIAVETLKNKGYAILERNWKNKFGEIDIIAKKDDIVVFVEVKTKIGELYGLPEEMVGKGKLQKVRNMATVYLHGTDVPCRIDVVAVVLTNEGSVTRLTHYENVY